MMPHGKLLVEIFHTKVVVMYHYPSGETFIKVILHMTL